jgi:hypothetical protein
MKTHLEPAQLGGEFLHSAYIFDCFLSTISSSDRVLCSLIGSSDRKKDSSWLFCQFIYFEMKPLLSWVVLNLRMHVL